MRTIADRQSGFDFISRCAAEKVTSSVAMKVLLYLYDCPKGGDGKEDSPTKLAVVCGVSTAAITGALDILEGRSNNVRRGRGALVTRGASNDRRRQALKLTVLGENLVLGPLPTA